MIDEKKEIEPSRFPMAVVQRDEFRRRSTSYRRALENIRKAYEAGDIERLEHLLFMYTALTGGSIRRPAALAHFLEKTAT